MQVEWKMVHVLVAIATRIAVATVIPIVPCNDITLCLFVCLLFVCMPYLLFIIYLFIYLFVNIIGFLHMHILYVAQYTIRHIYVSAIEQ